MPRCRGGKMPSRRRPANKRKATKGNGFGFADHLHLLNSLNEYYKNAGMLVECGKCNKWRMVKEYQEECEVPEFFECSMWSLCDGEKGNCYIPQLEDDKEFTNERYTPGSLVWAKMRGHPKWPAMVEDHPTEFQYCKDLEIDPQYHVVFFGNKVSRSWVEEKNIEAFSIEHLKEMPSRADLRRAIKDAVEAQKMKKWDRLMTFSFATRYGKKRIRLENKNARSIYTQLQTSKEDYTAGDLVWVERTGYPRCPGMVEKDPAEMRYCKDLDADAEYHIVFFDEKASKDWIKGSEIRPFSLSSADEMPLGELKKAIEDAEEAMKMTKQDRLMRFSFSVRNGKKRYQGEIKESERQKDKTGDQKLPDLGQHGSGFSTVSKRKRKHKSEAFMQRNLQPPGNSEERVVEPEIQLMGNHPSPEDSQPHICSGKAPRNNGTFKQPQKSSTEMNNQPQNEEINNDEHLYNKNGEKRSVLFTWENSGHGQRDSGSSAGCQRKRKHNLEAVTQQNVQSPGNPEEKVVEPEIQCIGNHTSYEDCQPFICNGKAPRLKKFQNWFEDGLNRARISDLSAVARKSGDHSVIPVITVESESEDEIITFEHKKYSEYLDTIVPRPFLYIRCDTGIRY